jgi:AbrB family looped-hinge helix DNA binding protein
MIRRFVAMFRVHGDQVLSWLMNEFVVKLGSNGRLVIPAAVRRALGVTEGDDLSLALVDDELRVTTISAAVRRAQRLMAQRVPAERSLADELIAERRAAAARE